MSRIPLEPPMPPSALVVLVALAAGPQATSDAALREGRLEAFLRSKGSSELGRDVCWRIAAKSLVAEARGRGGQLLFVHKGIGLVVPAGLPGLEDVRRRGGTAVVRGRVVKVPADAVERGDPPYALLVREITRRP